MKIASIFDCAPRAVLILFGVLSIVPCKSMASTPPEPLSFSVPFDVSHAETAVDSEVMITEHRWYYLYINVFYNDRQDLRRVMAITGDGSKFPDGRYGKPGIVTPIYVKISDTKGEVAFEGTVDVQGTFMTSLVPAVGRRAVSRMILKAPLQVGVYRIQAKPVGDNPDFAGTDCALGIMWVSNTPKLSN
jgi:hypothetical protein